MIEIRHLTDTPTEALHAAFLDAFADYAVDMQMPLAKFRSMLCENGFSPAASVGAFDDGRFVGFLFCAERYYQGRRTLYDCGTGVIPAFRGQHVGSRLLSSLTERRCADRFILEVLQDNASAVALYRNQGFHSVRELACCRCKKTALAASAVMPVLVTDALPDTFLAQASGLWDYAPTWQNSTASMLHTDDVAYAVIADGAFLIGYGALNRRNGSLMQLAVRREYRGMGAGSTLVFALSGACLSDNLYAINADMRDAALRHALLSWGFSEYAKQYEMELLL